MTSKDGHGEDLVKYTFDVTPMTILQIKSSTQLHSEAPFFYKGRRVNNVLLVATVNHISLDGNRITFEFNDSTSSNMYGKRYLDDHELGREDKLLQGIDEGMYVRVWARLTSSGRKVQTTLIVEQIRPVTDFHEVFYHVFNVAVAHTVHKRDVKPEPLVEAVGLGMDVAGTAGAVEIAGADANAIANVHVSSREVCSQSRDRPVPKDESCVATGLQINGDNVHPVTGDARATVRLPPPQPKEPEPEPEPDSDADSDSSSSYCSTVRHDSDGNVTTHSSPSSSGSDVYLTGSEGESVDSNEAYDDNDWDAPGSTVNTHSAPEPGPEPEEGADRLVHPDNFHSAAATRFDGYASSDVASERGGGGPESESESGHDSDATVMGGNGPSPMVGGGYSRSRTFRHKQSGTTDSNSELPVFEGDDSDEYSGAEEDLGDEDDPDADIVDEDDIVDSYSSDSSDSDSSIDAPPRMLMPGTFLAPKPQEDPKDGNTDVLPPLEPRPPGLPAALWSGMKSLAGSAVSFAGGSGVTANATVPAAPNLYMTLTTRARVSSTDPCPTASSREYPFLEQPHSSDEDQLCDNLQRMSLRPSHTRTAETKVAKSIHVTTASANTKYLTTTSNGKRLPVSEASKHSTLTATRSFNLDPYGDLPPLARSVMLLIYKNRAGDVGVALDAIVRKLTLRGFGAEEIDEAIDLLLREGYIHDTIDEMHFDVVVY